MSPTTIQAQGNISAGGDIVGQDKIVTNIGTFVERALTAGEEAEQAKSFEAKVLAQGVRIFVEQLQARASETTDSGGPYKGLLEYRLSDAELFFGRSQAIAELIQHLQSGPLTILHAESGAGKTSLLQAGIAPRLINAGHLPIYLRPYNVEPSLALKRKFISDPSQTPILATAPLRDFLRQVSGVLNPGPAPSPSEPNERNLLTTGTMLLICLDQFEEFFTQVEEPARAEFIRELAECLDDESLNVRWILALRTEYFGNLANFRPRIRNPFENDYRLNRLTRAEAQEVIAQPAAQHGLTFEEGVIEILLNDLGQERVQPPQIQLVCAALCKELKVGETAITLSLYNGEGGAAGILRGHLGRVLNRDLLPEQRVAARRLLEAVVTSEGRRAIRTQTELTAELAAWGVAPEALTVILDQLQDSRLLRAEETESGQRTYELTHDYLLDEIKLDPELQARKAAQELLEQETRAYQRFRTLLTVERLAIIESYRAQLHFMPEAEQLFTESQTAVKREQVALEARRLKELHEAQRLAATERRAANLLRLFIVITTGITLVALGLLARPYLFRWLAQGEMIPIPAGEATIGTNDPNAEDIEKNEDNWSPHLQGFQIEKFEVSNRQYRYCVEAKGCSLPMDREDYVNDDYLDDPVVGVTAEQAGDYCRWLRRRLPTELEWERAARGPQDSADVSPEGVFNLVGNAKEWTASYNIQTYGDDYDLNSYWNSRDPLPPEAVFVQRGGPRVTWRIGTIASYHDSSLGLRCAK